MILTRGGRKQSRLALVVVIRSRHCNKTTRDVMSFSGFKIKTSDTHINQVHSTKTATSTYFHEKLYVIGINY